MIGVGVDVHKHSLTAVAVDEVGRTLAEVTAAEGGELLVWSRSLASERLWAIEDCRQLTGMLEQTLLADGEQLVRVPPKLMAPQRRAGRERGKSDPIDALAVARAALREPRLNRPRPGEQRLRELKLLVDHRDDLVDERRRAQQRLRWHLHDLDPSLTVPLGALDRAVWLERLARRLARLEQTAAVRIARELVGRCRTLTRTIVELKRELQGQVDKTAPTLLALPGCGVLSAAKLLGEIGPIDRFDTDAQLARHAGVAPLHRMFASQPPFELQPPVARWLAGWLPQMAHWDWEPAPAASPTTETSTRSSWRCGSTASERAAAAATFTRREEQQRTERRSPRLTTAAVASS